MLGKTIVAIFFVHYVYCYNLKKKRGIIKNLIQRFVVLFFWVTLYLDIDIQS